MGEAVPCFTFIFVDRYTSRLTSFRINVFAPFIDIFFEFWPLIAQTQRPLFFLCQYLVSASFYRISFSCINIQHFHSSTHQNMLRAFTHMHLSPDEMIVVSTLHIHMQVCVCVCHALCRLNLWQNFNEQMCCIHPNRFPFRLHISFSNCYSFFFQNEKKKIKIHLFLLCSSLLLTETKYREIPLCIQNAEWCVRVCVCAVSVWTCR